MKILKCEKSVALHYNMCIVGGFLGAYALLCRGGNFGSAQTGNLIQAVICGIRGSVADVFIRLGALMVYGAALVAAHLLVKMYRGNVYRFCIIAEAVGMVLARCLPETLNPIVALYPVFFITAFQWGIFSGARGYNSATIFSTNNMKQMLLGWTDYIREKDQTQKEKALFYTITLAFFHGGVLLGCLAASQWGVSSICVCLCLLPSALALAETEREPAVSAQQNVSAI